MRRAKAPPPVCFAAPVAPSFPSPCFKWDLSPNCQGHKNIEERNDQEREPMRACARLCGSIFFSPLTCRIHVDIPSALKLRINAVAKTRMRPQQQGARDTVRRIIPPNPASTLSARMSLNCALPKFPSHRSGRKLSYVQRTTFAQSQYYSL